MRRGGLATLCGIVGILGREPVAGQLVDALKRLEYRGYDSAGVATLEHGALTRRRAEGKLRNLETRLQSEPLQAPSASATPAGRPTASRPRTTRIRTPPKSSRSCTTASSRTSASCAKSWRRRAPTFRSETDTEVIAHLVTDEMKSGKSPVEAVKAALPRLRGAFALAFLFAGEEDLLIGARKGSPLAVGYGDGEMYLGSDAIALAPFTDTISYLEDGDWAVVTRKGVEVHDAKGQVVERAVLKSNASAFLVDKGNHRHFMAKEIHEQPEVVGHTLAHYLDMGNERVSLPMKLPFDFKNIERVAISACGTAYYAGLVAKYWFERFARLPVEIDVASEFRYREAPFDPGNLAVFVSQSGETADTLATLALRQRAEAARAFDRQRADLDDRPRERRGDADAGRARDRRRLDQGVHLPARGAALPRHRGRPHPRHSVGGGRAQSRPRHDRGAAPPLRGASAGAADRGAGARSRQIQGRALSRPRHGLSDRARRRAEAEGNFLHPRRRLRGGRAQARADRADRRDHAGGRRRAVRQERRGARACSRRPCRTCRRWRRAAARSS